MEGDWKWRCFLDIETFNCPVCKEPLSRPIFQCENGHPICSSCSGQASIVRKGCPSCYKPTGRIRNLAVEKILDTLQVPCKHGPHGCAKMLPYNNSEKRKEHEEHACPFQSFPCPFASCSHEGPLAVFSSHLTEAHSVTRRLYEPADSDDENWQTFRMSSDQDGALLEKPRSAASDESEEDSEEAEDSEDPGDLEDPEDSEDGDEDAGAGKGLVLLLVHREAGDSLGDWFFCTAYGARVGYALLVKRADSDQPYCLAGTAHDFSRARAREQSAGAGGERLLVPLPGVARQARQGKLFGVSVQVFAGIGAILKEFTGDATESDEEEEEEEEEQVNV